MHLHSLPWDLAKLAFLARKEQSAITTQQLWNLIGHCHNSKKQQQFLRNKFKSGEAVANYDVFLESQLLEVIGGEGASDR
jgi:hypothetical protein